MTKHPSKNGIATPFSLYHMVRAFGPAMTVKIIISSVYYLVLIRKPRPFPPLSEPEALLSRRPRGGRVRVGVIRAQIFRAFYSYPPHPNPLPQGERGFPDGNYLILSQK